MVTLLAHYTRSTSTHCSVLQACLPVALLLVGALQSVLCCCFEEGSFLQSSCWLSRMLCLPVALRKITSYGHLVGAVYLA